jgi:hypothetical protein
MLKSSTAGPKSFSTVRLFSSFELSELERVWRLSISEETAPRSAWKPVRKVSTELRT